jgi:hypothetical protein
MWKNAVVFLSCLASLVNGQQTYEEIYAANQWLVWWMNNGKPLLIASFFLCAVPSLGFLYYCLRVSKKKSTVMDYLRYGIVLSLVCEMVNWFLLSPGLLIQWCSAEAIIFSEFLGKGQWMLQHLLLGLYDFSRLVFLLLIINPII